MEELRNGFVEILVHAIIKDKTLFQFIEENMAHIFQLKENILEELIYQDCKIKGEVVQKDEKDLGERAILNFGHTFGHAVESAYDYQYRHGQCVAHGILGVCRIVERLGLVSAIETKRI